jgi:hypothetical protein
VAELEQSQIGSEKASSLEAVGYASAGEMGRIQLNIVDLRDPEVVHWTSLGRTAGEPQEFHDSLADGPGNFVDGFEDLADLVHNLQSLSHPVYIFQEVAHGLARLREFAWHLGELAELAVDFRTSAHSLQELAHL